MLCPRGLTLRIETGRRGSGSVNRVDLEAYVRDVVVGELSVGVGGRGAGRPGIRGAGHRRPHVRAGRSKPPRGRRFRPLFHHALPGVRAGPVEAEPVGDGVDGCRGPNAGAAISRSAGTPIEAVFHAHCGGHTSAAAEVWRSNGAAYLRGVDDPYCLREQPAAWSSVAHPRDACGWRSTSGRGRSGRRAPRRRAGPAARRRVAAWSKSRCRAGRAPVVTGRRLPPGGAGGDRSAQLAQCAFRRPAGRAPLWFTGRGSGHGVGLCQIGLLGRLRAGQTPEQALRAYYPGATIVVAGT